MENRVGFAQNAFLGERGKDEFFIGKVEKTAKEMVDFGILDPGINKDHRVKKAREIVANVALGAPSVETLKQTIDRPTSTSRQVEMATEGVAVLEKAVFMVMDSGSDDMKDILGKGSARGIDNFLPEPLFGLGEGVRKNIVDDSQILSVLNGLDEVRENCIENTPRDRRILSEAMEEAYEDLSKLNGLNEEGKRQLKMVKAYLNTELGAEVAGMEGQSKRGDEGGLARKMGELITALNGGNQVEPTVSVLEFRKPRVDRGPKGDNLW